MDTLRIVGSGVEVDLYPWLANKVKGMEALAGIVGFGLPDVENQWFEGAGGNTWRGSRIGRRVINLPLRVYAESRTELWKQLSDLSTLLDPFTPHSGVSNGAARLYFGGPDDKEWFVEVVRAGGGDWSRKVDSNDRTFFKTTLRLEAGDAFWTRNEPEDFSVQQQPSGNPLLPRIAKLRVGSTAVQGTREVTNIGDTWAWPVITVKGPTTGVTLIGPNGETLDWDSSIDTFGALAITDTLTIDMRKNTVEDQLGRNRYGGLQPAPRFWYIAPGTSEVSVIVDNMTADSLLVAQWWPRRWAVV